MEGSRTALKNLWQLGLSQALTMALALLLKVYLPRVLGVEKAGLIFFAESIIFLYFSFLPLGIAIYIYREVPKDIERARHLVRPILLVESIIFIFLSGLLMTQLWLQGKDREMMNFVMLFAFGNFLGVLCFQIFKPLLMSLQRVSFVAAMDSISKLLMAGIVCVCLFFSHSVLVLGAGFAVAMLLTFAAYCYRLKSEKLWGGQLDRGFFQNILINPLPFFIHGALANIYMNLDTTLLGLAANETETGIYGAALRLIGIFLLFVPLVSTALIPVLSRLIKEDSEAYKLLLQRSLRLILIAAGLMVFPLILFSDELILLFYGQSFALGAKALRLLSPTLILTYCNVILAQHLTLASNGKRLVIVTLLSILLDLALNSFLIAWGLRTWGEGGAGQAVALTAVITEAVVFGAFYFLSRPYLVHSGLGPRTLALILPLIALIGVLQVTTLSLPLRCVLAFGLVPLYLFSFLSVQDRNVLRNKVSKFRHA